VPLQFDERSGSLPAPSWKALFDAAGLDMASFTEVTPKWTPRDYADARAAWEGPSWGDPMLRLRVEAAAYGGAPVSFTVIGPWTRPTRMTPAQLDLVDRVAGVVVTVIAVTVMIAGLTLARRHIRAGRADRRGAGRLALFVTIATVLAWLIAAHHSSDVRTEFGMFYRYAGDAALTIALVWVLYVAIEPYVRKLWPDSLLGWSRLLAGHIRDPRVGRDVLAGVAFGVAVTLSDLAKATVMPWLGYPAPYPTYGDELSTLGVSGVATAWVEWLYQSIEAALLLMLIFIGARLVFRRETANRARFSRIVTVVVMSALATNQMGGTGTYLVFLFPVVSGLLFAFVVFRFGLLSFVVALFVWRVVGNVPMMLAVSHWSAIGSNLTLALLVGLTLFAFYASRAGQPLFGTIWHE
jgi:serine/threonine-protein kinase